MAARSAGTRRRVDGSPRRSRHAADAELTETARRRLRIALGPAGGPHRELSGGWVPQPPPGAEAVAPDGPGRTRHQALGDRLRDRLPPGVQAALVAPSGRALVGLLLVVAVAVLTTGATAWVARPQEQPVPGRAPTTLGEPLPPPTEGPTDGATATASAVGPTGSAAVTVVLVHVAGAVRRPGIVELSPGARVAEAVEAAGGVTRTGDPASVNLARPVVDGEQVVVARRGQAVGLPAAAPSAPPSAPTTGPPVDLNTASLEQLDGLPGIGPVLAQRILDWRTANGRFSVVDELGEVSGIGEATLADLRPLVTV